MARLIGRSGHQNDVHYNVIEICSQNIKAYFHPSIR